jgi:hypothetical protein
MKPLCLCQREEYCCEKCLRCVTHCECSPPGAIVHRNSRAAVERYANILRSDRANA